MNNDKKDIEFQISNVPYVDGGNAEEALTDAVGADVVVVPTDEKKAADAKDSKRKKEGKEKKSAKENKDGDKTKTSVSSGVLGNKTIEDVIKREAHEEQLSSSTFSISKTLGGVIIARVFQKQIGLVFLVCVFLIIYISNRYVCQQKMVEIAKIEKQLQKARYNKIVCTSMLTEKCRESNVIDLLSQYGDTTLAMPNEPPYLIEVQDE